MIALQLDDIRYHLTKLPQLCATTPSPVEGMPLDAWAEMKIQEPDADINEIHWEVTRRLRPARRVA